MLDWKNLSLLRPYWEAKKSHDDRIEINNKTLYTSTQRSSDREHSMSLMVRDLRRATLWDESEYVVLLEHP
jgi:hypothetical protein